MPVSTPFNLNILLTITTLGILYQALVQVKGSLCAHEIPYIIPWKIN
jgi:hypothetical protein